MPTHQEKTSPPPRIGIVIPVLNGGRYIQCLLESIRRQEYPNVEVIVVDGGSTDGTLEVLGSYGEIITTLISEKDTGQADAIRKGLSICTAEIYNWINSDDTISDGWFSMLAKNYRPRHPALICGSVDNITNSGGHQRINNENITLSSFLTNSSLSYHQPGIWFSCIDPTWLASVIRCDLDCVFDHALMISVLGFDPDIIYTSSLAAKFLIHRDSKTSRLQKKFHQEMVVLLTALAMDDARRDMRERILLSVGQQSRRWLWRDEIDDILNSSQSDPVTKLYRLLLISMKLPTEAFNRITLGAVKRIIFGSR
jgi:glycosyltransferase involved in cell wall biosynthesis